MNIITSLEPKNIEIYYNKYTFKYMKHLIIKQNIKRIIYINF